MRNILLRWLLLPRLLQRENETERERERESVFHKVLAHTILDAEQSHDLESSSWKPRKASGLVQRPDGQRANGIDSCLRLKA